VIAAQKLLLRARAMLIASSVLLVGAVRLALARASVPGLTVPGATAAVHAMAMHP
jgi:hypothetical protein